MKKNKSKKLTFKPDISKLKSINSDKVIYYPLIKNNRDEFKLAIERKTIWDENK